MKFIRHLVKGTEGKERKREREGEREGRREGGLVFMSRKELILKHHYYLRPSLDLIYPPLTYQ